MAFEVKDSGAREEFASGMVRDTQAGKLEYDRLFDGPMADRWAALLTKAATEKYLDSPDGTPNWMLADSPAELKRARKSVVRHLRQWLRDDVDEDHAAAVMFNLNLAEYVKARLKEKETAAPERKQQDVVLPKPTCRPERCSCQRQVYGSVEGAFIVVRNYPTGELHTCGRS